MKKYLSVLLAILAIVCFASYGCDKEDGELSVSSYNSYSPSEIITGRIEGGITGKEDRVIISLINSGDETYKFHNSSQIEILKDGVWYAIPYELDYAYQTEEFTMLPNSLVQMFVDIGELNYKLEPGQYRIAVFIPYELVSIEFVI